MVNPKRISLLPIEIPPNALAVYNAANLNFRDRLMRRPASADLAVVSPRPRTLPVQSVADQRSASHNESKPNDPKTEWFSRLSVSAQRRELNRLIGLRKLGLDDDCVAEIMREAVTRTRSAQSKR
jgi:hypothetical protein